MRFMLLMILGGYESAVPGATPDPEHVNEMARYNEELQRAGVLLALDGLHPPSEGARVSFRRGKPTVSDGPLAEAKEVLGGYWVIDVGSRAEAVEWARRCPARGNEVIEVRQVQEMEDFPQEVRDAYEEGVASAGQRITPFLWFEKDAEKAAEHYVSVFESSRILEVSRYPDASEEVSGQKAGSVMTVAFELHGTRFTALNGGHVDGFTFSPATSFVVNCRTQEEIDHLWSNLSAVPEAEQCGWCTDKFGVTWQIVPAVLNEMLSDPDKAKVERVTAAFLQMKKFDIGALQEAYRG